MSYCTNDILGLASGIYSDVGSPTSQSVAFISGWITSSGNLGDINNRLSTSFYLSGDAPCITDGNGGFGAEEADIVNKIYSMDFYETMSSAVLMNAGGASLGSPIWMSLAEGDTKITRLDITKLSAAYLNLQSQAQKTLQWAVHDYKLRILVPVQVSMASIYSRPS